MYWLPLIFPVIALAQNVLMISTDDMSAVIKPHIDQIHPLYDKTPNLDKLMEDSYVYSNAYVQYPVCGPSRASIFTGRYPDTTKNYNFVQKVNSEMTIPKYFKEHGYQTISLGKNFHRPNVKIKGGNLDIYQDHWTYRENGRTAVEYHKNANAECTKNRIYCKKPSNELTDQRITTKAIELINQLDSKWFMAVGFRRPHINIANPRGFELEGPIPLPNQTAIVSDRNLNYFGYCENMKTRKMLFGKRWRTILNKSNRRRPSDILRKFPSVVERFLREYYISITWIDHQIGRLIEALKSSGKWESTIILFVSDHGWNSGEHGFWCKNSLLDGAAKVPLIIRPSGGLSKKKVVKGMVEGIDIFPTLAKLAGLPKPSTAEGMDITKSAKSYAFSQYPRCKPKGQIQNHACMYGDCKLPTIKWMGYSVREKVNNDVYMLSGWWPFKEVRNNCSRLSYVEGTVTTGKFPRMDVNKSRVNWEVDPVDVLLLKNGIKIIDLKLREKYIEVIRKKFT